MLSKQSELSGRRLEVLRAFFKLGCTAFGGLVAHLGFFRQEFVEKRRWIGDADYADIVALCQFLPGPASSQVGLAVGWKRAGYIGALCAWLGFTTPSAVLMLAFAYGVQQLKGFSQSGWVQGLKIAAVAVVAQAHWQGDYFAVRIVAPGLICIEPAPLPCPIAPLSAFESARRPGFSGS